MRTVTSSASLEAKQSSSSEEISKEPIVVLIEPRTPIKAYIRKDLLTTTRDIQTFMFMLMPLVLPFMVLIPLLMTSTGLMDSFNETVHRFFRPYQSILATRRKRNYY